MSSSTSSSSTSTSQSRNLPWYKRCPADWQRGTRACGMSMELRGFYSECLDAMWDLQGMLPRDPRKLALLLGCNKRTVAKLLPQLIALGKIFACTGGYYNPRMLMDVMRCDEAGLAEAVLLAEVAAVMVLGVQLGVDARPVAKPAVATEFASDSAPIQAEFASKVPKNPAKATREVESESESDSPIYACDGILIDQGRVIVAPSVAAAMASEYPGVDLAAVADFAAPEMLRFRAPSAADKLAVLRKWARIALQQAQQARPMRPTASAVPPGVGGRGARTLARLNRLIEAEKAASSDSKNSCA